MCTLYRHCLKHWILKYVLKYWLLEETIFSNNFAFDHIIKWNFKGSVRILSKYVLGYSINEREIWLCIYFYRQVISLWFRQQCLEIVLIICFRYFYPTSLRLRVPSPSRKLGAANRISRSDPATAGSLAWDSPSLPRISRAVEGQL